MKIIKIKLEKILESVGNYAYNNLKSNKILLTPPEGAFLSNARIFEH